MRDWLLHRDTNDLDLVVPQGAISLARAVADAFRGGFFVLDEERDVARATVRDSEGRTLNVDVARLRTTELLVDLSLRDFTINAMAVPLGELMPFGRTMPLDDGAGTELIDPFGGAADSSQGLIRAVTEGVFLDDPLRMLRAVRQAAELGFRIEDATYNLIRRDAPLLTRVAAERARDELARILSLPGSWHWLEVLQDAGLLIHVLPETAALVDVSQPPPCHQDLFDHTRSVLAHLEGLYSLIWPERGWRLPQPIPPDSLSFLDDAAWADLAEVIQPYRTELRTHLNASLSALRNRRDCLSWAALAHDWGKPAMRSAGDTGKVGFMEYSGLGVALVQVRLRALRMASNEVGYVSRVVELYTRPGYLSHDYPPSRRSVYRFFRDAIGTGPDCVLLSLADHGAVRAQNPGLERWTRWLGMAGLLLEAYFRERAECVDPPLLLNGEQIMSAFGLSPGRTVGLLLEGLREAQAAGEVGNVEEALVWLAQQVKRGGG